MGSVSRFWQVCELQHAILSVLLLKAITDILYCGLRWLCTTRYNLHLRRSSRARLGHSPAVEHATDHHDCGTVSSHVLS